jgi:hypothetical protein
MNYQLTSLELRGVQLLFPDDQKVDIQGDRISIVQG